MRWTRKLTKNGNSLQMIIPIDVVDYLELTEEHEINIELTSDKEITMCKK
jgi:antitoxin component of MazEF toxin-antitoxin module